MHTLNQTFLDQIQNCTGPVLWVLDEHPFDLHPSLLPKHLQITFLSNRIDQVNALKKSGIECLFSDFDFSVFDRSLFEAILYRVSKEKAVVHHIINQSASVLKEGGLLYLAGGKHEGIKTYTDKAAKYLNCDKQIEKLNKDLWLASLHNHHSDQTKLDDKNYSELTTIGTNNGLTFISKPGVFGWNKIDQGSDLLIEQMPEFIKRQNISDDLKTGRVLDLGCGYGYLLANMKPYGFSTFVGTDNNASAIAAIQATLAANDMEADIIPANCADTITDPFDAIVCNPPFHQGFSVENEMTDRFLATTRRLLVSGGAALFVVNAFIPLEEKAKKYFKRIDLLAHNKSFKVIRLSGKRPVFKD
ncbi:class I SAM-dependent methyltransferase [Litoribacillus peritrichatus]|uniref:Class I SAM-dependent methyltransferase n=1 Tax=Litoribacillus peritrichatus TaxID=718191 RepID=A0ABP7M151_9GAMM